MPYGKRQILAYRGQGYQRVVCTESAPVARRRALRTNAAIGTAGLRMNATERTHRDDGRPVQAQGALPTGTRRLRTR